MNNSNARCDDAFMSCMHVRVCLFVRSFAVSQPPYLPLLLSLSPYYLFFSSYFATRSRTSASYILPAITNIPRPDLSPQFQPFYCPHYFLDSFLVVSSLRSFDPRIRYRTAASCPTRHRFSPLEVVLSCPIGVCVFRFVFVRSFVG